MKYDFTHLHQKRKNPLKPIVYVTMGIITGFLAHKELPNTLRKYIGEQTYIANNYICHTNGDKKQININPTKENCISIGTPQEQIEDVLYIQPNLFKPALEDAASSYMTHKYINKKIE